MMTSARIYFLFLLHLLRMLLHIVLNPVNPLGAPLIRHRSVFFSTIIIFL